MHKINCKCCSRERVSSSGRLLVCDQRNFEGLATPNWSLLQLLHLLHNQQKSASYEQKLNRQNKVQSVRVEKEEPLPRIRVKVGDDCEQFLL